MPIESPVSRFLPSAASQLFPATTADSIFGATISDGGASGEAQTRAIIDSQEREINRIRGYKLRLTASDNQRLTKLQERITEIDRKAADGTVRQDELSERSDLFREADTILGKPSADVEGDLRLTALREKVDDLLKPRLDRARANRLRILNVLKEDAEQRIEDNPDSATARKQIQNLARQISQVSPPRQIDQLSQAERKEYDLLVEQVNEHAKAKLLLDAREQIKVNSLLKSVNQLKSSLPADPAGQPTAGDVARAYVRIG